jgi:hypothetical protein
MSSKTLYDVVQHLVDAEDVRGDETDRRRALRAAISGATDVAQKHQWKEYQVDSTATLFAPVVLEMAISSEGVATVSDGDIPSWAVSGSVLAEGKLWPVLSVGDDSLTLRDWGGAVLSTADFKLVNNRIVMTDVIRSVQEITEKTQLGDPLHQVSPPALRTYQSDEDRRQAPPKRYAVGRFSDGVRKTEITLSPAPASDTTLFLRYHRHPVYATMAHDCGSVTISSDNPKAASIEKGLGSGTDFLNAILVISETEELPAGFLGIDDSGEVAATLQVVSKSGSKSLVLAESAEPKAYQRAVLTQTLDLPDYAWNAVTLYAQANFYRSGRGEVGLYWQTMRMADEQLKIAMSQEATLANPPGAPVDELLDTTIAESLTDV